MLNGGDDKTIVADNGGQASIHHLIEVGGDVRAVQQVCSDKFNTVVDRCRVDGQGDRFAGMNTDSCAGYGCL